MNDVAEWLNERECVRAYVVFPELPCTEWCSVIDAIDTAKWHGATAGHNNPMWIDREGRTTTKPSVTWWIARFDGHDVVP